MQPSLSSLVCSLPGYAIPAKPSSIRNVGLVVALEDTQNSSEGIVIATTHLFWHPSFPYERTRQAILLLRAIERFKAEHQCESWPTILAGDLNTEPREATYQLLINPIRPLGPHLKDELESSRLLHQSVDKAHASVTTTLPASESTEPAAIHGAVASTVGTPDDHNDENDDDDEEGQQGPDTDERSIAGTRPPTASDGLLSVSELIQAFQSASPSRLISAYDIASPTDEPVQTFATRGGFREHADVMQEGNGRNEPAYTCYTPLFRLTLDYLLLFEQQGASATVTQLLRPARTEELGEGLPRKGVCASDHLAVGCEIAW